MKKIIFIVYTAVFAATGLCALAFREQVHIVIDSLIPVGVLLVHIILGMLLVKEIAYFYGGKIRMLSDVDFKYKKDPSGEGNLEIVNSYRKARGKKERLAVGYAYLLCGALAIPFIFFFKIGAKWASIGLLLFSAFLGSAIAIVFHFIETRAEMKAMNEVYKQQQKELEDQKKREELGKWK